ncbi:universal stress protein [Micromonospora sp. NBC_00898]|uniref:universal stress protein n=1 Tax=Micromonospora sp. NBC_00898 TaxID=2975981 RepID=UPI0038672D53|nr:universal stress protein [Micromonospora sp. NBC_00898]
MKPQPIIVGLDGTTLDASVLAVAVDQAALTGATLRLVHGMTAEPSADGSGSSVTAARRAEITAMTDDLKRQVTKATGGASPAVEYEVRHGDPATVLLAAARNAALIIVGTRGSGGGSPFLLGPVSQDVAVHASIPVLLVPTAAPER